MVSWVYEEFSEIDLGDKRVNSKALKIIDTLAKQPGASIPQAFDSWSDAKCCYEFFSSGKVQWEKILHSHENATLKRIQQESVVLLPADTSSLNYTSKPSIQNLGHIANKNMGIWIHPLLAITPERVCLGAVNTKIWTRTKKNKELSDHELYSLPIEEKEIYRWIESYQQSCIVARECPETQVIMMSDRESDFAELFQEVYRSQKKERYADVIIRSAHDRAVEVDEGSEIIRKKLRSHMKASKALGIMEFTIPATTGRPERKVTQTLKAARVTFKKRHISKAKISPKVTMNAVMAIEENPPKDAEPLIWVFLTTLPIHSFEQVAQIINYYLARWEIETFFKVLKSGCKIEEKRSKDSENLKSLIAVFLVVAWRILYAMRMGRIHPDLSSEVVFTKNEWMAVYSFTQKRSKPPTAPPPLGKFIRSVAKLGGYLDRKNDPPPGPKALWIGMSRMYDLTSSWEIFNTSNND